VIYKRLRLQVAVLQLNTMMFWSRMPVTLIYILGCLAGVHSQNLENVFQIVSRLHGKGKGRLELAA
jgi:hypothetical protein